MFTIDASVHLNAANPSEQGSDVSRAFFEVLKQEQPLVYVPTLLPVEVAAGIARNTANLHLGQAAARLIWDLPAYIWIPLDAVLAEEAIQLASRCRVRGADAVYAAVAHIYNTALVTLDLQQLERLPPEIKSLTPQQALASLGHR